MTTLVLSPTPRLQFFTAGGVPLSGGKLFTYTTGTTTPLATYADSGAITTNANPVIMNARGEPDNAGSPVSVFLGTGIYKFVLKDSADVTIWTIDPIVTSPSAGMLSAVTGADLIGFIQPQTSAVATTLLAKNREEISTLDFMSAAQRSQALTAGIPTIDSTAAMHAALAAAQASKLPLRIVGNILVTNLLCTSLSGLHLIGDGSIYGTATAAGVLWEWVDCSDITVDGRLSISGVYNTGYTIGWWQHSTVGVLSQYFDVRGLAVIGVAIGVKIGDKLVSDAIISESAYYFRYFYGCKNCLTFEGTGTIIEIIGGQITTLTGAGDAAWIAATELVPTVRVIGSAPLFTGCEIQRTSNLGSSVFDFQPITSAGLAGTVWGQLRAVNCEMETASPLLLTSNPSALGAPLTPGYIIFSACAGSHSQNSDSFITTDSTYVGDVVIDDNCRFFKVQGAARTMDNITCGNAGCNIYFGDNCFALNFVQGMLGMDGGTAHYTHRMILDVYNLAGVALPDATDSVLKFTQANIVEDLGYYSKDGSLGAGTSIYTKSSGLLTVPAGGLRNIQVTVTMSAPALTGGTTLLYIYNDATIYGIAPINVYGQCTFSFVSLPAGATISAHVLNNSGAARTPGSSVTDRLQVFASN